MLRGIGYGLFAGLACGVLLGGAWGLVGTIDTFEPIWLVAGALDGGIVGGIVGLGGGIIGGVAFALFAPRLAHHAGTARRAGAAVLPGAIVLGWGALAIWRVATGRAVLANWEIVVFLFLSAVGGFAGAMVGPRVLYGKRPAPSGGEGDAPCPADDARAGSSR